MILLKQNIYLSTLLHFLHYNHQRLKLYETTNLTFESNFRKLYHKKVHLNEAVILPYKDITQNWITEKVTEKKVFLAEIVLQYSKPIDL